MKTAKLAFIFLISIALFACIWTFYVGFLKKGIESNKVATEILSMKIEEVRIDTSDNEIYYGYLIENKYKIYIYRELPEAFKSVGRYYVFIKDINGNLVFTYDTKYPHSNLDSGRTSDYEKLMKHLKLN
jgi:hypothetical protein